MQETIITNIIDKHLQKWIDLDLNSTPGDVPKEMLSTKPGLDEDWQYWLPIKSSATDEEIIEAEKQIGYVLPESFKILIKHKHFDELCIDEATFSGYLSGGWQRGVLDPIFDAEPREFLIDKGYIPFARYSDWGLLCFDTHHTIHYNEYPVVLWDHEVSDEFKPMYLNFTEALIDLDKKDDASRNQT